MVYSRKPNKKGRHMKKTIIALVLLASFLLPCLAHAVRVSGYHRKDGTYVQSYERSAPNNTVRDNYSYEGNQNPYTGKEGHNHNRDNPTSEYYDGTSSRGSNVFGN